MTNDQLQRHRHANQSAFQAAGGVCLLVLLCGAGGCVSQRVSPTARGLQVPPGVEMAASDLDLPGAAMRPQAMFSVATLGAGDALGRAILINDMVLAAAQRLNDLDDTALADVPTP